MTAISKIVTGAGLGATLAACSPTTNPPLFFAQTHTFGVGIHGSPTQQSADLTLGYRDLDIAIVPVSATDGAGQVVPLTSIAGGGNSRNALSVLGQFNANAAATAPTVSLGTFFATGLAADKLADGFGERLSKSP
jgi:hypothetical protein